ncbi:hypothetical protein [Fusobacterium sp. MFO224]|uniref:hypothetical protein n=1 Tax=Fusobacterium sp. MFO224 TaxID=3378070 RepID=UPI00385481EB
MKKILVGFFVLSAMSFANTLNSADKYLEARVGWDINAEYDSVDYDGRGFLKDNAKSDGFEFALERMMKYANNWDFGVGVAYQDHADRKTLNVDNYSISGGEYDSIPVYLVAKYNFNLNYDYIPYLKANLGYAFNFNADDVTEKEEGELASVSVDDGMYFAIGGGLEYNDFTIDLMYGIIKSDMTLSGEVDGDYSGDHEKLTLSVGYKFDM